MHHARNGLVVLRTAVAAMAVAVVAAAVSASPASAHANPPAWQTARQTHTQMTPTDMAATPVGVSQAPSFTGNTRTYPNAEPDTSFVIRPTVGGSQTLVHITGRAAPTKFTFSVPLPPGTHFRANANGGADIVAPGGRIVGTLAKPWAKDSHGKPVTTHYTLHGNQIVQTVDHHGAAYPVVADPSVHWHWWGVEIDFTKHDSQLIAWLGTAACAYFGCAGPIGLAVWLAIPVAKWAADHGYCAYVHIWWNGNNVPGVYRC